MSTRSASAGGNKAVVMESETPSVSSSSASSCSSGDGGGKPKAGLVASYLLRSAWDWRGSPRVDTLEQREMHQANNYNQVLEVEATSEAQGGEKERDPVEVEAEPDAATGDNRLLLEQKEKEFEVTYQCLPDVEESVEEEGFGGLSTGEERGRRPMQYLDVLLQTDEHGVGLNLGVEQGGSMLIVQSFRRLNEGDRGPAEACGKIRVGDMLHAVDGEEVASLQQLHLKLAGRLGKRRKFVLLRFLRPVADEPDATLTPLFSERTRSKDTGEASWAEIDALLRSNPQIARLVRQLATTNQVLQDQLIDSRLKQEEQNIQLDQLHALYARTQAEGLPLFSLSKSIRPFSRKASFTSGSDVGPGKSIPTKIQMEVMEAVSAEYSRLQQEFQLQHVLDKRDLERKYAEKMKQLEEATAKKVKMLEFGFQEALEHYASDHSCSCHSQAALEISDGGSSLHQHDYYDARKMNEKDAESCRKDATHVKLDQIMNLLAEYEEMKYVRTAKLQALSSITLGSSASEIKKRLM